MSNKTQLTTFNEIIEVVLEHEGGYVNDPTDLGGETNFGITKRFYPDVDIKNLTKEGAKEIYKRDYWDKNRIEEVPQELEALDKIKDLVNDGSISLRDGASWIAHKTGRYISHQGLKNVIRERYPA